MGILVLDEMSEPFHGVHKLGTLAEAVLASLFAGYVFFLSVQQITESKKLSAIAPFVKMAGRMDHVRCREPDCRAGSSGTGAD
jgi:hypothetical protein